MKKAALALLSCALLCSCVVTGGGRCYRRRSHVDLCDVVAIVLLFELLAHCWH